MSFLVVAVAVIGSLLLPLVAGPARAGGGPAPARVWALGVHGAVYLAGAIYAVGYVASEDTYRRDGRSRWEVYDGHALTVVAITAAVGVAVLSLIAARTRAHRRAFVAGATGVGMAGVAAAVLLYLALVVNTSN